jgi:hypothetical protein
MTGKQIVPLEMTGRQIVPLELTGKQIVPHNEQAGQATPELRQRVRDVMDSVRMSVAVMVLVVVTVFVELPRAGTIAVLLVFCTEAAIRIWAMGVFFYITDPFCAVDFILVIIDVLCLIAQAGLKASGGRLVRMVRVFKFMKFIRLIKGLRCFRSTYRKCMPPKKPKSLPPVGVFFRLLESLDTDGDGRLSLAELEGALKASNIPISADVLSAVFTSIYDKNQGLMAIFDDDIPTILSDEERTVSYSEIEGYIHTLHPSTKHDRFVNVAKSCMKSWRWWAIFGNLLSKIIIILGIEWIGPFQAYIPGGGGDGGGGGTSNQDRVWVKALHQCLNIFGSVGFVSLYIAGSAQRFDVSCMHVYRPTPLLSVLCPHRRLKMPRRCW